MKKWQLGDSQITYKLSVENQFEPIQLLAGKSVNLVIEPCVSLFAGESLLPLTGSPYGKLSPHPILGPTKSGPSFCQAGLRP